MRLVGPASVRKLSLLVKNGELSIIPNMAEIEEDNKKIEAPALEALKEALKEVAMFAREHKLTQVSTEEKPIPADLAREYIYQQKKAYQDQLLAQQEAVLNDFMSQAHKKSGNDAKTIKNYLSLHDNTIFQIHYAARVEYVLEGRKTRLPSYLTVYMVSTPEGDSYHIDKKSEVSKADFIKTLSSTEVGTQLLQQLFALAEKDKLESAIQPIKKVPALSQPQINKI